MSEPAEPVRPAAVQMIVHGHYTDACYSIGQANLPTILAAEREVQIELGGARAAGEKCNGYHSRLKLVRARRRKLEAEARQRREQAGKPHTFRP